MQLLLTNGAAIGRTPAGRVVSVERPAPAIITAYFTSLGFRPAAALAVAHGALRERAATIRLGQAVGLLAASGGIWGGEAVKV